MLLPFYGPATPRQDIGNFSRSDLSYACSLLGPWGLLKYGVQSIDKRANTLGKESLVDQAQDPYATFASLLARLGYRVNDGKSSGTNSFTR